MKKFILFLVTVSVLTTNGQTTLSKQSIDKIFEAFSDKSPLKISARSQPQCLEDSTIISDWDSLYTSWENNTRIRYFYNSDYLVGVQINSTWNKTAQKWIDDLRTTNYYDVNKRLIKSVNEVKSATTGQWRPDYQLSSVVYTNNDITTQTYQAWDTLQSLWVNDMQRNYTYNANHNLLTETYEIWMGSWKVLMLNTATYDASYHFVDLVSLNWDYSTNSWNKSYKQSSFVYDANNNITSYLILVWDQINNVWSNGYSINRSYSSSNKVLTETQQIWQITNWQNYLKFTYTYDAANNLIASGYNTWSQSAWVNQWNAAYTYDNYNNQTSCLINYITLLNGPLGPFSYTKNYFNCAITGVKEELTHTSGFNVFPNPAINDLSIKTPFDYNEIRVFDTNGKQVMKNNATETISLSGLNPGVYSICLIDNNSNVIGSKRFIKLP